MLATPRCVRRDGIHFQGLRYVAPTLAAYVGETVTIRYDPRDVAEIRVFHRNHFLCRAVSEEHAGEVLTLKDIEAARRAHRRALRASINERVARVADFLPVHADPPTRFEATKQPPPDRPGPSCVCTKRTGHDDRGGGREGASIAPKEHRRFVEVA